MKISTYHKRQGDHVVFYKGKSAEVRDRGWDAIYIATVFTYYWKTSIDTIKFYSRGDAAGRVIVGGVLASLLSDDVGTEAGVAPHVGLWDTVDAMPPDYHLFDGVHRYAIHDASFAYTTRGCIRRCSFCAVPRLEPRFVDYIPLRPQIDPSKKDLMLLDNNVLASSQFERIIQDIRDCGFGLGATLNGKRRRVDFNQGVDVRLLRSNHMRLLSTIAVDPLRLAFDHIELTELYVEKVRLAHSYGVRRLSNYILYNYGDSPEDLYRRLRVNIELNEELGLSIFSFPMRYIPLDAKQRGYVDNPHWTKRQLRGVQCILHATRGVVGPRRSFFEKAFGASEREFKYIVERSEREIFYRDTMPPFNGASD